MYKLVIFTTLLAVTTAAPGFIGGYAAPAYAAPAYAAPAYAAPAYASHAYAAPAYAAPAYAAPIATGWGHGVVSAPLLSAPIVKTAVPVATSYANTVKLASPSVVAAHAPIYAAHAPYVAAPAYAHGW